MQHYCVGSNLLISLSHWWSLKITIPSCGSLYFYCGQNNTCCHLCKGWYYVAAAAPSGHTAAQVYHHQHSAQWRFGSVPEPVGEDISDQYRRWISHDIAQTEVSKIWCRLLMPGHTGVFVSVSREVGRVWMSSVQVHLGGTGIVGCVFVCVSADLF